MCGVVGCGGVGFGAVVCGGVMFGAVGCGVVPPPPPKSTIKFVWKPRSMQPPHTPKAQPRKSPAPPGA